jgi:glycosyltransferase involved in cell wall biosynthesis
MKVSVVIPCYNNEATIAETLESVFAQRFEDSFEVIVVNDGSTDGTRAVLRKFGDRIAVIDQENRGVAAARNLGIAAAAGEYIALLDGDDTWTEDKLAKSVQALDKSPACVAVYSNVIVVDGMGREVSYYVAPEFQRPPSLDEMLEWPWPLLPSAIVIRRNTLMEIGGFREEFGRRGYGGEDTFAFILARERGEIHFVPDKLVRYRIADCKESFAKRVRSGDGNRSIAGVEDPGKVFEGYLVFARLVRDHFGARGRPLVRFSLDRASAGLVSVGLVAMHEGDRGFARRCYRASIAHRPLWLKTYFRLAWAMLPAEVARRLSPMLAPRLRRSVSGPPFSGLQDHAQ